tara:strand:- start:835 stop:1488 length:654 start_codon:yes stop_codon:yes gene_type:complete
MVVSEEVFDKVAEEVVKKPKRKLTEKQLENLAKGRERMKEKREADKIAKEAGKPTATEIKKEKVKKQKEIKVDNKTAKEGQTIVKERKKEKRRTLKEINKDKENAILQRLEKEDADKTNKNNARLDLFTSLKIKCLEQAKSLKEYSEIQQALNGIDDDTLHNDVALKEYAKQVMKPYIKQKADVCIMPEPKHPEITNEIITEKPNVTLTTEDLLLGN